MRLNNNTVHLYSSAHRELSIKRFKIMMDGKTGCLVVIMIGYVLGVGLFSLLPFEWRWVGVFPLLVMFSGCCNLAMVMAKGKDDHVFLGVLFISLACFSVKISAVWFL